MVKYKDMAKSKSLFICSNCGASYSSWSGRCGECGAWNSLEQQQEVISGSRANRAIKSGKTLKTVSFGKEFVDHNHKRFTTSIKDIDEVLGGGVVPGGVVLIAGQPGIGKSTLLLQLAYNIANQSKVLYVSGEESPDRKSVV